MGIGLSEIALYNRRTNVLTWLDLIGLTDNEQLARLGVERYLRRLLPVIVNPIGQPYTICLASQQGEDQVKTVYSLCLSINKRFFSFTVHFIKWIFWLSFVNKINVVDVRSATVTTPCCRRDGSSNCRFAMIFFLFNIVSSLWIVNRSYKSLSFWIVYGLAPHN